MRGVVLECASHPAASHLLRVRMAPTEVVGQRQHLRAYARLQVDPQQAVERVGDVVHLPREDVLAW